MRPTRPRSRPRPHSFSKTETDKVRDQNWDRKKAFIIGFFDFLKIFWYSNLLIRWFYEYIDWVRWLIALVEVITSSKYFDDVILCRYSLKLFLKSTHCPCKVVNGPTSSGLNPARTQKYKSEPGPNPKTNLKPKSYLKKFKSKVRTEKSSNVANLFWLYFCAHKTKSTSQAQIKPEISVNFRPEPSLNPTRKVRPDLQLCAHGQWKEDGRTCHLTARKLEGHFAHRFVYLTRKTLQYVGNLEK